MVLLAGSDHVKYGYGIQARAERLGTDYYNLRKRDGKFRVASVLLNPTAEESYSYLRRLRLGLVSDGVTEGPYAAQTAEWQWHVMCLCVVWCAGSGSPEELLSLLGRLHMVLHITQGQLAHTNAQPKVSQSPKEAAHTERWLHIYTHRCVSMPCVSGMLHMTFPSSIRSRRGPGSTRDGTTGRPYTDGHQPQIARTAP